MPAIAAIDHHAERVGHLTRDAFVEVLDERLVCLAAHGSAVTGYIRGFSDFDFVVLMYGRLTLDDSLRLQERLGEIDIAPFTYLQLSRVVDLDNSEARHTGLIDGAYALIHGAIPEGLTFHDEAALRDSGREVLRDIQRRWHSRNEDWAVEGVGPRSTRRLRLFMTHVKPGLRALLVERGEPVMEAWTADYPALAARLSRHEPALAGELEALLASLPASAEDEARAGACVMRLLDGIGRRAREMGVE